MTTRRRWTRVVAATLLASAACTWSDSNGVRHHRDREGVFSIGTGDGGGFYIPPPPSPKRSSVTFGFFVTCTEKGRPVRLDKVTWSSEGTGAMVTPYLRRVPPKGERNQTDEYQPAVLAGTPWSMKPKLGGRFVRDFDGQIVRGTKCDDPPGPDEPRDDFVMVITAGPQGARVDRVSVYYTAGNKRYAVDVNYDFVMCGTEVSDPDCPVSPRSASPRD